MKILLLPLVATLSGGCVGLPKPVDDHRQDGREMVEVPPNVFAAARERLPGFAMTASGFGDENGAPIYELEGLAGGQHHKIDVTPAGRVLRVER